MTTLKDRVDEAAEITKLSPLHYLHITVSKDVRKYNKQYKIHTILNGRNTVINLSVIPHVYDMNERKLTDKEVASLKAGTEVLIPVFLKKAWDTILTVETFPGRNDYAIWKDEWDKIILDIEH